MRIHPIHPPRWARGRGYSHGILVKDPTRFVYVAGQIAWDEEQRLVGGDDFTAQFRQALANVVAVVRQAGGQPEHVVQMRMYVVDKGAYLAGSKAVGEVYRELMGEHYPAMALVQVADLLEDGALVEIEATAALP